MEQIDVAIIGAGPAGLQAALVLARTGKDTVVFDAPTPPRNGASHGVHNFVGLDGLLPRTIRDQAWSQIERYRSTRHERRTVSGIERHEPSGDLVVVAGGNRWQAREVILTCGYEDLHPDLAGFDQCWADTIIPCPFCDGYENRDRVWGIVPSMTHELEVFPSMVRNWTEDRMVIAPPTLDITAEHRAMLDALGVPLHVGTITELRHDGSKLRGVTLDTGQRLEVETLLWTPDDAATPLVTGLVDSVGLALDETGDVVVDEMQRTNVDRLWAAGDVQGWMGALEAANVAGMAAAMIVHGWYGLDAAAEDTANRAA